MAELNIVRQWMADSADAVDGRKVEAEYSRIIMAARLNGDTVTPERALHMAYEIVKQEAENGNK